MICFSIFAMPSFVSPFFQIMPSLIYPIFTHKHCFAFVLHLRFDNILLHWLFYIYLLWYKSCNQFFIQFEFGTFDSVQLHLYKTFTLLWFSCWGFIFIEMGILNYYIVYICVRTGVINSLLFYYIYVKNTQPSKFVFILSVIKLSFNFYGTQIFCVNFVANKRM